MSDNRETAIRYSELSYESNGHTAIALALIGIMYAILHLSVALFRIAEKPSGR